MIPTILVSSLAWWAPVEDTPVPMEVAHTWVLSGQELPAMHSATSQAVRFDARQPEPFTFTSSSGDFRVRVSDADTFVMTGQRRGEAQFVWHLEDAIVVQRGNELVLAAEQTGGAWVSDHLDISELVRSWSAYDVVVSSLPGTHQVQLGLLERGGDEGVWLVPFVAQRGDQAPDRKSTEQVQWYASHVSIDPNRAVSEAPFVAGRRRVRNATGATSGPGLDVTFVGGGRYDISFGSDANSFGALYLADVEFSAGKPAFRPFIGGRVGSGQFIGHAGYNTELGAGSIGLGGYVGLFDNQMAAGAEFPMAVRRFRYIFRVGGTFHTLQSNTQTSALDDLGVTIVSDDQDTSIHMQMEVNIPFKSFDIGRFPASAGMFLGYQLKNAMGIYAGVSLAMGTRN